MTKYREDGSIESINNPVWDNRYLVRDHGIYRGIVRKVIFQDEENNETGVETGARETLYTVQVLGGSRDGQLFHNCRLLKFLGGVHNSSEVILKAVEGVTAQDATSITAAADLNLNNPVSWNGDVVYLQFLDGNPMLPIIVGLAKHPGNKASEATKSEGQRLKNDFNGISTEIDKEGNFKWIKQNGFFSPSLFPNPNDPLNPYFNEFVPDATLGKDAISMLIGNKFDLKVSLNTNFSIAIDGILDTYKLTTKTGLFHSMDGLKDVNEFTTKNGASVKLDGLMDKYSVTMKGGASLSLDGLSDKIELKTKTGDSLSMTKGVTISDSNGNKIVLSSSGVKISEVTGGAINLSKGKVAMGGSAAELVDILSKTLEALGQATYSGFGAPASNVALYIQLKTQIDLIKGSL